MEILYYFENKSTFMDQWQHFHIINELHKHNCNITIISPLDHLSIDKANEYIIKKIKQKNFDIFMTPYNDEVIYHTTLDFIKKYEIATLLICFDNLLIPFRYKKIAKYFDLVWLTSKETMDFFKKWGANVIFLPYAANPYNYKTFRGQEINKILFIGTPYGSRANVINTLTKSKINVNLYTNKKKIINSSTNNIKLKNYHISAINLTRYEIGRKVILAALIQKIKGTHKLNIHSEYVELHNPVEFEELNNIYSSHSLCIASTEARNTGVLKVPVNVVNLRSFEIPMSGGLQICAYFNEIAEYFEEDKEIIFYSSEEEFIEKSIFYLRNDNQKIRLKMKRLARRRALAEHTWLHRFKKVFDYFNIKNH